MKKIFFSITVLAAAVACNKAEIDNDHSQSWIDPVTGKKMITEIVSGQRGSTTKATISDDDLPAFAWTIGDNIAVHVSNGKYVFTSGKGGADKAEATAAFTVAYPDGTSRDAFAVFPSTIVTASAANYGQSGHTLDVTLPSTYTLAQVQGEVSPCPMIATNTESSTTWVFYQLCGLLRLTMNSIPPSTKRLEIDFDGKKVWGDFSIANPTPGTSSIATSADDAHDIIKITNSGNTFYSGWGDGKVFNIPLPVGTYTNITVTAYNALSGGDAVLTVTRPFTYTASNEYGTKRTASFPVFSINPSRSKRVIFAPGNLQATTTDLGENWTWSFAEHQYDFIGNGGGNTKINGKGTLSENGTVDLFGWSTENTAFGIYNSVNCSASQTNDYKGTFVDWGTIKTFGGITYPDNYWKTLSSSNDDSYELWYMMRTRQTNATVNNIADARFTMATINTDGTSSVNGIILFPDYYEGPLVNTEGITWGSKINDFSKYSDWGGTRCTKAGWKILEAVGCVFLPAAGTRVGVSVSFGESYYASSTNGNNYQTACFHLSFSNNIDTYNVYWNQTKYRYQGASVRLAHEVQ